MKGLERQAIAYTSACHGMVHILELTYGVVLISIAQEFGASLLVLGILANILGFTFGLTALPAGFLADRISERHLLILCCLGMGGAAIAVGLSLNVYMLGAALAVLGVAIGIYHPVGTAFITRVVSQRGLALGYQGIGGSIGQAIGPLLAGVIAAFLGWRAAYLIFAVPALLLAVMFFFSFRSDIPLAQPAATKTSPERLSLRPYILPLLLIFVLQVMNGFIYRGVITFLPLYLSQRIHFTLLNLDPVLIAGSFTAIALAFGVVGQFLGGYLLERRRHENLAFVTALVGVPILVLMGRSEGAILMVAACTFALFHFMGQPVYNCLVADYSPASWRGRAFGISYFCIFGLGSFSASLMGYIADQFGTNWVFTTAAGFGLLILICTGFLMVRAGKISKQHGKDFYPGISS